MTGIRPLERTLIDEIARRARGHCEAGVDGSVHASPEWFADYTRLVAEECAKVVDASGEPVSGVFLPERDFQRKYAAAIRAKFRSTP